MTLGEPRDLLFAHDDPGTSDATWFADSVWDSVPVVNPFDLIQSRDRELVVVSAHPDDETLAVGGTITALAAQGVKITLVLATAGERSHPDSAVWDVAALAEQRMAEWHDAGDELAPEAHEVFLNLPDGQVEEHEERLTEALESLVGPDTVVLAPFHGDGHPDHEAVGRVARHVVDHAGAVCWEYPVWWWHWNDPSTVQEYLVEHAVVVEPGVTAIHAKHRALDRYPSQVVGLGPGEAHGPVVTRPVWHRARRTIEVMFHDGVLPAVAPAAAERSKTFNAMYDAGDDPWGWEDSWYESRRRGLIGALLRRPRYRRVLELGCGTGLLTAELAPRADTVEAVDVSERALAVARRRGLDRVTWHRAEIPAQLPLGPFDLVVVSEVAYFLRPTELMSLLRLLKGVMTSDAELLFADWVRPTTGIPLDGPLVHEMVEQLIRHEKVASYRDDDVWIESWSAGPSVATREGLV